MISYTQKQLRNPAISTSKEWLLTDGDGGYACSTISFMNTRRQHSLLTVSTNFPLKRFTLLNKLDEEVIIDGKSYMLSTNQYPGTIFPEGFKYLSKFVFDHFPQVTFDLDGRQITKKVLMPRESSAVYCHYENHSNEAITIRLLPLISFRPKDMLKKAGDGFLVDELPDGVRIIADLNLPKLYLKLSQIYSTSPESHWYYDFIYEHDTSLYDNDREDLFNIGFWETELEPGKGLTFAASTRDLAEFEYPEIEAKYIEMVENKRATAGLPKRFVHLSDSAFNHLARSRAIRSHAIVDGYPYGGLTIRDSLVSMDGISYSSDKMKYENEYLYDMVANEVSGTFPSTVDEETFHVNYNDQRMPLYFALALKRLAEKDKTTDWLKRYLPVLEDAAEILMQNNIGGSIMKGTNLIDISGGTDSGYVTVVENATVNALWYNLLKTIDEARSSDGSQMTYSEATAKIESSYYSQFFAADGNYKGVGEGTVLLSDMALPLVLPFSPLTERQKEEVFRRLSSRLLDSLGKPELHAGPGHACNLMAIYLTESGSTFDSCAEETAKLREVLTELLTLHEFTNCVNGLPRCGIHHAGHYPRDVSTSVVTGEAIRVIKKLKLR